MTPFIAEIIGTALMMLLGNGVVANVVLKDTKGSNSGWIVITTAWAFAVFVGVVVAGPYSGAHLNPAVTLALAITGKFPWESVPVYIAGEFIGAMITHSWRVGDRGAIGHSRAISRRTDGSYDPDIAIIRILIISAYVEHQVST